MNIGILNKLFSKSKHPEKLTSSNKSGEMVLKIDDIIVGYLNYSESIWTFKYSQEFIEQEKYHSIVGFSDKNKTYKATELWPFFKIRIPGLKQPMIKEIIQKENIQENEFELLKRFGNKTISNPYILVV